MDSCVSYREEFEYMQFCGAAMLAISLQAQQSRDSQLKYTFVAVAFKQVPGMRKTGGIDRHVNTVVVYSVCFEQTHPQLKAAK